MERPKLFQYAILWHPTEKQIKEEGLKSKILIGLKTVLARDIQSCQMMAAMEIPAEYKDALDQIEVALTPF